MTNSRDLIIPVSFNKQVPLETEDLLIVDGYVLTRHLFHFSKPKKMRENGGRGHGSEKGVKGEGIRMKTVSD